MNPAAARLSRSRGGRHLADRRHDRDRRLPAAGHHVDVGRTEMRVAVDDRDDGASEAMTVLEDVNYTQFAGNFMKRD